MRTITRYWHFLPLLGAVVFCFVSHFNGLYGQDAHEYLRQSRAFFVFFQGGAYRPDGLGDASFAANFPIFGAVMHLFFQNDIFCLQFVSFLSAVGCLFVFERSLALFSPGTGQASRSGFTFLLLACAPVFLKSSFLVMSDAMGLLMVLCAFYFGLLFLGLKNGKNLIFCAFFIGLSVTTRFSSGPLFFPFIAVLVWQCFQKRLWLASFLSVFAGLLAMFPHFYLKKGLPTGPLDHSLLQGWALANLFQKTFANGSGTVHYHVPNLVYLLSPLACTGFFAGAFLLVLASKKADFRLPGQRAVLACLFAHLLFLGGLPHQNLRYLLPAYALFLVLVFPAWGRFWDVGFRFLKKKGMCPVLALIFAGQVFFSIKTVQPVVWRNRLELDIAQKLRETVQPGAILYAFDLDVALKSYCPTIVFKNLWEKKYAGFEPRAYFLFNEPLLRQQWAGKNPMLNWESAQKQGILEKKMEMAGGWTLFEVK